MKTSELAGFALDWAVAKCEGYEIVRMRGNEITFLDRTEDGALSEKHINYSTDWSQGGPIIEREKIELEYGDFEWWARIKADEDFEGTTPLIAAMRCYVASKLGDDVELPEEIAA